MLQQTFASQVGFEKNGRKSRWELFTMLTRCCFPSDSSTPIHFPRHHTKEVGMNFRTATDSL
jgi:hypothetical protein